MVFSCEQGFSKEGPEKMNGAPVFPGTRVPINHLFDYLEAGDSLNTLQALETIRTGDVVRIQ